MDHFNNAVELEDVDKMWVEKEILFNVGLNRNLSFLPFRVSIHRKVKRPAGGGGGGAESKDHLFKDHKRERKSVRERERKGRE